MNRQLLRLTVFAALMPVVVAGCAGNAASGTFQPSSATGAMAGLGRRPLASKTQSYVYVADYTRSAVNAYPASAKNPEPAAEITAGVNAPYGLAIDAAGTLYVVNAGNATLTEYPAGSSSPSLTIRDGLISPVFTAIDATGNVWISNTGLPGNVVEYAAGGESPIKTLTTGVSDPTGLAIDAAGKLLVANNNGTGVGNVAVFAPGAKKPSKTFGNGILVDPQSINLDKRGNIYVTDFYNAEVYVFDHRSYKLIRTIPNCPSCGIDNPIASTIAANNRVYVSLGFTSEVYEFAALGKKGPQMPNIIEQGLQSAWGVAADPPVAP
jgi:DNA-binding beta-propeller fold protein YncE